MKFIFLKLPGKVNLCNVYYEIMRKLIEGENVKIWCESPNTFFKKKQTKTTKSKQTKKTILGR